MYYLGFDIGGSSIKAVLVKYKNVIKSAVEDSPDNFEDLLIKIARMKDELTINIGLMDGITGIGFALPGTINRSRDIVLNSPNIKYLNNQPIKKLLEEKLKPYPIKIEHDVHCFLMAEKEIGFIKDMKNVFFMTLGTGIGGAWMINGEIFFGEHGSAGEAGHMIMDINNGLDLEELASNKFLKKTLGIGSIESTKRAKAGEDQVIKALEQLGKNLGVGIANVINVLDPEAIILGGGITDAKDFIMPGIKEGVEKFVISPNAKETKILFSELSHFGGALGATMLFNS